MSKPRLAIVISHPIQHWVPVYQALAQANDLVVKVFFVAENGAYEYFDAQFNKCIQWDVPLTDGYEHEFLSPGKILESFGFFAVDSPNISARLQDFAPDFVWLHGYSQRVNWRSIRAVGDSANIIYSSDSNIDDQRSWWRKIIKNTLVRAFLKKCDYFLSCSPRNRSYLLNYGVNKKNIINTSLPVDMARLEQQAQSITFDNIQALKSELGLRNDDFILLFAGKLIPHKRPHDVIEAINLLRSEKISAVIVGSGELSASLRQRIAELKLEDRIKLTGFVNQSSMANYFSLANALVFPSSKEPYGAIASEVLPFGLPIIAADNIGAVGASIQHEKNALLYACGSVAELAQQIKTLLDNPELTRTYSSASKALVQKHDKSVMASDIKNLCLGKIEHN